MVNLPRDIRQRLRRLRHEQEPPISQYEMAERAGLGLNRYWRIENGYVLPTPAERERIAQVYGLTVQELFPGMEVTRA